MPTKTKSHAVALQVIPVAISAVALLFGAYQYWDARAMKQANAQLERIQKQINLTPEVEMEYVDADANDINVWLGLVDEDGNQHSQPSKDRLSRTDEGAFDGEFKRWLDHLEEVLPFKVNLTLIETTPYKEMRNQTMAGTLQKKFTLVLIRNSYPLRVTKLAANFISGDSETPYQIPLGTLEQNSAFIAVINSVAEKPGASLPGSLTPVSFTYYDDAQQKIVTLPVRQRYSDVRLVVPGITFAN